MWKLYFSFLSHELVVLYSHCPCLDCLPKDTNREIHTKNSHKNPPCRTLLWDWCCRRMYSVFYPLLHRIGRVGCVSLKLNRLPLKKTNHTVRLNTVAGVLSHSESDDLWIKCLCSLHIWIRRIWALPNKIG